MDANSTTLLGISLSLVSSATQVADAGASPDAHISIQCADFGLISDDLTFLKGTYTAIVPATSNEV